ncbi:MAG: carboxymuconolactone decarboxylase family protein [Anaerolineales bacterium]|nr:carboxymuconolactone decarboxylase family protein [Anaerolineales bacterium]
MSLRFEYDKVAPKAIRTMYQMENYIQASSIEFSLRELVKLRASQINGCAYCIDMHTKEARAAGETEQRLYGLSVWRETPYYSGRERAALAWTEAQTLLAQNDIDDELYDHVRDYFSEQELVDLTMIIIAINGWNRIAVGFKMEPGTYEVAAVGA